MSEDFKPEARRMIDQQLRPRGLRNEAVLNAMASVPRHRFVPERWHAEAYADRALPNAEGQTISQPYIVALMTELLDVSAGMRVLEVGTGSGYQTAVLVALGADVVTIERSEGLSGAARRILGELGHADSVKFLVGDGTLGCADEAPYDRILVTAAAPKVPVAYRDQLAESARMVIPMGDRSGDQALFVIDRCGSTWDQKRSIGCVFVPLIGQDGWSE